MKLYEFSAKYHGQVTFFIVAENEEKAKLEVDKYVQENHTHNGELGYYAQGWGSDYYTMEVHELNKVVEHANE